MLTLADLLAAGARLHGPANAEAWHEWSYDSRLATPGSCFVALRTVRADGHDYSPAALAAGATGLLCAWPPPAQAHATLLLCDNPAETLLRWAGLRLAAIAPTVVAVTGSVGKTSACRAIAAVLARHSPTFHRDSFNSTIGLPVALASLEPAHSFAVLEFGSDNRGEIAALAARFPPRIGVVTAIGAAHIGRFGSIATVAAEKGDLLAALPDDGVAIINGDDHYAPALAARTAARVFTIGQGAGCDLQGAATSYGLAGTNVRIHWRGRTLAAQIALIGAPALGAVLAAVAVGLCCGLDLDTCVAALAELQPTPGRLCPLPGPSGAILLDDSFSATPPAAQAALETLAALPARRRIAILGALSDLPAGDEEPWYRALGAQAAHSADLLLLKGDWGVVAARAARAARPEIALCIVDTAEAAIAALPADLGPGDLLLIKGSAEARMERVVARLVQGSPELRDLLVRQEPAWRSVRVGDPERPTWLRIDLDAIAHNLRRLRAIAGVPVMAVLKADGYGHGAVRVARAAIGAGAASVAVATLGEARALRANDIHAPILLLGYTPPWQAHVVVGLGLDCTLFDDDAAKALSAAGLAAGRRARVHVKVDTGMARLGLRPAEVAAFLRRLHELPGLEVVGLYTHFAGADSADLVSAELQLRSFCLLLDALTGAGLRPPLVHAANSAATLRLPAARFDLVRPGIACYGLQPGVDAPLPTDFRPALSLHSEVAQVKAQPAGTPLSYGGSFVTARRSHIATIPIGYADGLRRAPAWREVLIRGQRAPIVGRICMDYALVDVTEITGVKRGDAVVLIGAQGDDTITADEVANWLGTISYEVLTGLLPRVPREVDAVMR